MLVNMSSPYAEASTDVSLSFPRSTYLRYCTTRGHLHHGVSMSRWTPKTAQGAVLVWMSPPRTMSGGMVYQLELHIQW